MTTGNCAGTKTHTHTQTAYVPSCIQIPIVHTRSCKQRGLKRQGSMAACLQSHLLCCCRLDLGCRVSDLLRKRRLPFLQLRPESSFSTIRR